MVPRSICQSLLRMPWQCRTSQKPSGHSACYILYTVGASPPYRPRASSHKPAGEPSPKESALAMAWPFSMILRWFMEVRSSATGQHCWRESDETGWRPFGKVFQEQTASPLFSLSLLLPPLHHTPVIHKWHPFHWNQFLIPGFLFDLTFQNIQTLSLVLDSDQAHYLPIGK